MRRRKFTLIALEGPSTNQTVRWKDIPKVPTTNELIDIVLSATHRKLPTQIRSGFKISRIRAFYTRKVKFAQEMISEKLGGIIEGFPRLNDVHPFHRDLYVECCCRRARVSGALRL